MANKTIYNEETNLKQIDQAIVFHDLSDDEITTDEIPSFPKKNLTEDELRKEAIIKALEKELLFLGLKEGNATECRDLEFNDDDIEYRGTMRKRIKTGLIMEYSFSSRLEGIKNFHLNNVEVDLNSIPEDKLKKLYIITRFFNSIYRKHGEKKEEKQEISAEELEKIRKEKEKEKERQMVLGKL